VRARKKSFTMRYGIINSQGNFDTFVTAYYEKLMGYGRGKFPSFKDLSM